MRDDDRVAIGWAQPRTQADGLAMIHQPAGCRFDFGAVMALGGNAGETEIVAQFADETGFVFTQVGQDVLHGRSGLKQKAAKGKRETLRRRDATPGNAARFPAFIEARENEQWGAGFSLLHRPQ